MRWHVQIDALSAPGSTWGERERDFIAHIFVMAKDRQSAAREAKASFAAEWGESASFVRIRCVEEDSGVVIL